MRRYFCSELSPFRKHVAVGKSLTNATKKVLLLVVISMAELVRLSVCRFSGADKPAGRASSMAIDPPFTGTLLTLAMAVVSKRSAG